MTAHSYRIHGWTIDSDIELAAAPAEDEPQSGHEASRVTLTISHRGQVSTELPDGEIVLDQRPTWPCLVVRSGSGFLYRVPETYEAWIDPARRTIEVTWDPRAEEEMQPVLLGGGVLAIASTLFGRSCMHATAVAYEGAGIAITGPPGQGKTTTAAYLVEAGARLVAEDVIAPIGAGTRLRVPRGLTELRFRESAHVLALRLDADRTAETGDGRTGAVPSSRVLDDLTPLTHVVLPMGTLDHDRIVRTDLSGTEAFLRLIANHRLEGWVAPEINAQEFALATAVAEHAQVMELEIPWQLRDEPGYGRMLLDAILG